MQLFADRNLAPHFVEEVFEENYVVLRPLPFRCLDWHRAFIEGFAVPHANFFSCLVRVSSIFGAFYNANISLAVALRKAERPRITTGG